MQSRNLDVIQGRSTCIKDRLNRVTSEHVWRQAQFVTRAGVVAIPNIFMVRNMMTQRIRKTEVSNA